MYNFPHHRTVFLTRGELVIISTLIFLCPTNLEKNPGAGETLIFCAALATRGILTYGDPRWGGLSPGVNTNFFHETFPAGENISGSPNVCGPKRDKHPPPWVLGRIHNEPREKFILLPRRCFREKPFVEEVYV